MTPPDEGVSVDGDKGEVQVEGLNDPEMLVQVKGKKGDKGDRGHALPREVMRAFWAIVLVAFLVTAFSIYEATAARNAAHDAHSLAKQNRAALVSIRQQDVDLTALKKAQADSCKNYETLRAVVNDFQRTIRQQIINGIRVNRKRARVDRGKLRSADLQAVARSETILVHTHTVTASCAQKRTTP